HVLRLHLERAARFVELHRAVTRDHVIRLGLPNQRLQTFWRENRLPLRPLRTLGSLRRTSKGRILEAGSGHGDRGAVSIHEELSYNQKASFAYLLEGVGEPL